MEFFLARTKRALRLVLFFVILLQFIFWGSLEVLTGCLVSILSFWLYEYFVLRPEILRKHPVTFLALTGLECFTYFAPIFTLLDGNPITFKIDNPYSTFSLQFIYILLTFIAFKCSLKLTQICPIVRNVLNKIGYFDPVSDTALWLLGGLGLVARLYLLMHQYGDEATQGAGTISLFLPFLMAPYCTMFRDLFDYKRKYHNKKNKNALIIYTVLLLAMGIASNSRNSIVTIIMGVLFMYLINAFVRHNEKLKSLVSISKKRFFSILIGFIIITGPLSDFAMAMVAVRSMRADMTAIQLVGETVDIVLDRESMDKLKQSFNKIDDVSNADWDETYVSNVFAARLCNYLVADKTIFYAQKGENPNPKLTDYNINRMKLIFPQPIVDFFFGHIDKSKWRYSPMDCLLASYTGHNGESFLVGGDVGLGIATFGYLYPLFQIFMYMILLSFMDQYVKIENNVVVVPVITLLSLYSFFYTFIVGNGILFRFVDLLWAIPLGLLLKTIMLKITSKLV